MRCTPPGASGAACVRELGDEQAEIGLQVSRAIVIASGPPERAQAGAERPVAREIAALAAGCWGARRSSPPRAK
jgi:hypothetical protein